MIICIPRLNGGRIEIFKAARHPKSFITLDSADYLLSRRSDARYAARVCAAWVDRYLSSASAEKP
jgi:putative redox protein